jgi:phosphatidylglycerol---prolipoprotein diacylglyceryl transferase
MPVVVYIFGVSVRTYSLCIVLSLVMTAVMMLASVKRDQRRQTADAALGALLCGLLAARAQHILINWSYFDQHRAQILSLTLSGLGWHGALIGGLCGLWLGWRIPRHRTLPFARLLLLLAPALPLLMTAGWLGCAAAGCGYGEEVRTLADYPPLVTSELADIYGILAPRWNTPLYGITWASVVFIIVTLTRRIAPHPASIDAPFWLTLALLAAGMFGIGYARADLSLVIAGLRADQVLDLIVFAVTLFLWLRTVVRRKEHTHVST